MALIRLYEGRVESAWVDANGHMNDGYYAVAFGIATWAVQDHLGLDPDYRARTGGTLYTVEVHINYMRELHVDQKIHVETQMIGVDQKRIRVFHRMYATEEAYLAATMDNMMVHFDQNTGKTSLIPDDLLAELQIIERAHAEKGWPADAGRQIRDIRA